MKGFPTIYFKAAGKEPVAYDGERETDAMAAWLSEHATHKFAVAGGAEGNKGKKARVSGSTSAWVKRLCERNVRC